MRKLLRFAVPVLLTFFAMACSSDSEPTIQRQLQLEAPESRAANDMQLFDLSFFDACCTEKPEGNLAVTPLSARFLLSMLANGIEGEAVGEITTALGTGDLEAVNTLSQKLTEYLPSADRNVKVAIANSVWYQNGYNLNSVFGQYAQRYYQAQLFDIDFNHVTAGEKVNKWIRKNTNGLIDKIVEEGSVSASVILFNTLYYKGRWTHIFDKSKTKRESFHGVKQDATVEMMHDSFKMIAHLETDEYNAIKLPMGEDELFEAVFVLPVDESMPISMLNEISLSKLNSEDFERVNLKLALPKMKLMPEELSLDKIIRTLGIKSLNSSLNKIFDIETPISHKILQKAVVTFDETGVEAAGVTGGMGETVVIPEKTISLTFNRPFVFFINEAKSGACLFAGRVCQL